MLIIVGREYEGFYRDLKARQEASGKDRVILDRRGGKRRLASGSLGGAERGTSDRRLPLSDAERALMNVLGFTVLQRELKVISGERIPRKPTARRAARKAPTHRTALSRKRAVG